MPTHSYIYPVQHTPPSGRRWGLTNRPFISCQSSFIGFKWSLITTVLQSPIMVFFPPYGVWWEGEAAQRVRVCVCVIFSLLLCTSLHFTILATYHFNKDSFPCRFTCQYLQKCVRGAHGSASANTTPLRPPALLPPHPTPHPRGEPQKNVARNLCGPRA